MKKHFTENILLGLIVLFIFLVYWHTFYWLVSKWLTDPEYSYGFLIPVISGYIVWNKKEELARIPLDSSRWGLLVIALGLLTEAASVRAGVSFTSAYSFIAVLLGLALYLGGNRMLKELSFPILFLFFMVPFFQFIIDPINYKLRLISSYLSVETIHMLNIPVYREGNIISIARGTLEVAAPCSGIRSMVAFLMLGTIAAYFAVGSMPKKITLLLITTPLTVLGNTVRIVSAVLLLHFQGIAISNTHWETALGLVVFMLVILGLLMTGRVLNVKYEV